MQARDETRVVRGMPLVRRRESCAGEQKRSSAPRSSDYECACNHCQCLFLLHETKQGVQHRAKTIRRRLVVVVEAISARAFVMKELGAKSNLRT